MDGFDNYGIPHLLAGTSAISTVLGKNYSSVTYGDIRVVPGRYGNSHALRFNGNKNASQIKQTISATGVTSFIVGFNFYMPTLVISDCDFQITNNTQNNSRGIRIYAASTSVDPTIYLNGTSMGTIARNTWHHIEAVIVLSGPSELFVNGTSVGTTANSMSYDGTFQIWRNTGNSNDSCYIDDYYVMDNTGSTNNARIGSASYIPRIETLVPRSDVSNSWTITAGTFSGGNATVTCTFEAHGIQTLTPSNFEADVGAKSLIYNYVYVSNTTNTAYAGSKYLLIGRNNSTLSTSSAFVFTTIANSVSFYLKSDAYYGSPTITVYITVNGTTTAYTANSTWTQYTLTLNRYSTIMFETDPNNTTNRSFCLDNIAFTYSSQTASIANKSPEDTSGSGYVLSTSTVNNTYLFNMDDLSSIKSVKAAATKVHTGYTTSATTEKLIGSGSTEFGTTINSNQASSSGNWNIQYFDTDPVAASSWSESGVNAFQLGLIKKT